MKFLRSILQKLVWKLWGRRKAMKEVSRLIKAGPPSLRDNGQIYRTMKYEDMHLEHYPPTRFEVLPPPDSDDTGLN